MCVDFNISCKKAEVKRFDEKFPSKIADGLKKFTPAISTHVFEVVKLIILCFFRVLRNVFNLL